MKALDHWPFAILLAVFCVLAGSFSLLLPLSEMPDEGSHFDLVRFVAEQNRFPMTQQERSALGDKGDASPIYHGLVAVLSQHVDIARLPQRYFISSDKQPIPYDTILTTQRLHTDDEAFPFRGIVLAWHLARLVSIPLSALTQITLRAGLPSVVRETLAKSADFTIFVRDRKPFVRFSGKAYVLPRTGQRGIPVVSVNTAAIDLSIYRIGDRNLLDTVLGYDFQRTLSRNEAERIASTRGVKLWSCELAVEQESTQPEGCSYHQTTVRVAARPLSRNEGQSKTA